VICRCEPHASGSNRCAFCLAEAEVDLSYAPAMSRLDSAVRLIQRFEVALAAQAAGAQCGEWLQANGYECELTRKLARERRAAELDVEIERLRAERAKL
jgi:hypothetical protein